MKETRMCAKCGRELPVDAFYKGSRKDGLDSYCKECRNEISKSRRSERGGQVEEKPKQPVVEPHLHKVFTDKDLAKYTPRQLMLELRARGYRGELAYEETIVHRISLSKLE